MNRIALLTGVLAMAAAASAADTPAITIRTDIFQNYGSSNHFTLLLGSSEKTYVDVDCGFGEVEYEIAPALWDAENFAISGTPVDCTVSEEGEIRIYGDAGKINYIYAEGADITHVEMSACVNMEIVDLQHNNLQALDLSGFPQLTAVYLTDNPFTAETPLIIGPDHPELTILEVDIVGHLDPGFDINTYGNLMSLDAYATPSLTHLDPTGCPKLLRISVDSCPITTLDVSQNPDLMILNIEDSGISHIDVTHNPFLCELYATHRSGILNTDAKITEIDLTHNPELTELALGGNRLKSLDISANTKLVYLNASHNLLTGLDASAQTQLYEFNVSYNDMGFATLPLPQQWYGNYVYNQNPVALEKCYKEGSVIDLSSKVMREGSQTEAILYMVNPVSGAEEPLDESAYSFADGRLSLLKEVPDSVYARFTNTIFEDYPMTTSRFMIKSDANFGQPSRILTFGGFASAGDYMDLTVCLDGASAENPKPYYIDWGDGMLNEYESKGDVPARLKRSASGQASVYVPEGETLTAFRIADTELYSIDLWAATELRHLSVVNTGLYGINLGMNRCLQTLDLRGNNFAAIDLTGANGEYSKNVLSDINLSNNRLTQLTLNDRRTIKRLDLSHNSLTELGMQDFDNLEYFSISGNELTEISLAYLGNARSIDISDNQISEVVLPDEMPCLETFDVHGNRLTLATLPYFATTVDNYVYAPQAELVIPSKAPGVDLSSQCRVIDGVGTDFTWLLADGTPLPAADYSCENGATRFLNPDAGSVYCVMSNPAFPLLTGENSFRTSIVEIVGMPTRCIASFVTGQSDQEVSLSLAAAEKEGTALYIDWNGDGTGLEQYPLTDVYTIFTAYTKANAEVKVYTYSADEHITVFSITGASMKSMDASGLVDCRTFSVCGAGLKELKMPDSPTLAEIDLEGNELESFDFTQYPDLFNLSLNANNLTSVDLTPYPNLQLFHAADNQIENAAFGDNRRLWQLNLSGNKLAEIDLATLPGLENLSLSENALSAIDFSCNPQLRAIQIDRNRLTFSTLPLPQDNWLLYLYANQYPVDVKCVDGIVDLSSQAEVGDVPTLFRWYLGVPEFDDNGELQGEELYVDDEYTVANGITTFHTELSGVMCVMTNEAFPKLYLYTNLIDVTSDVLALDACRNESAEYYDLQGRRVDPERTGSGIYIERRGDRAVKKIIR